jgi:hypothetical protein
VEPGPARVKVVVLMLEGCIAALKVAVTNVLGQMPPVLLAGATETTVGAAHAVALVVKVHVKLLANAVPDASWAPVVIVPVYSVFSTRALDGVKVAVDPA